MALPFIDRHSIRVAASQEDVWDALESELRARSRFMRAGVGRLLVRAWRGTRPAESGPDAAPLTLAGFRAERSDRPRMLLLAGNHRFASYTMTFHLAPLEEGRTRLSMDTHAAFAGLFGSVYRRLVIGTGAHRFMVRRMLRRIRRRAEQRR